MIGSLWPRAGSAPPPSPRPALRLRLPVCPSPPSLSPPPLTLTSRLLFSELLGIPSVLPLSSGNTWQPRCRHPTAFKRVTELTAAGKWMEAKPRPGQKPGRGAEGTRACRPPSRTSRHGQQQVQRGQKKGQPRASEGLAARMKVAGNALRRMERSSSFIFGSPRARVCTRRAFKLHSYASKRSEEET